MSETGDRLLRLSGSTFSIELVEPLGWKLATRAAPQIANFIFHPEGTDWRRAEAVIFVRIVPRASSETVREFIEVSDKRFRERCPFEDGHDNPGALYEVPGFQIGEYRCPGIRDELLAVTEVPGSFVVFTLSTESEGMVDRSAPVLRKILTSFRWYEKVTEELSPEN
jgi:hypothetical protein